MKMTFNNFQLNGLTISVEQLKQEPHLKRYLKSKGFSVSVEDDSVVLEKSGSFSMPEISSDDFEKYKKNRGRGVGPLVAGIGLFAGGLALSYCVTEQAGIFASTEMLKLGAHAFAMPAVGGAFVLLLLLSGMILACVGGVQMVTDSSPSSESEPSSLAL